MTRIRFSILVLLVLVAATAAGKQFVRKERAAFEYSIAPNGAVVIENPVGSITVIGTDGTTLQIAGEKVVSGVDDAAMADGLRLTQTQVVGTDRVRVIRTLTPKPGDPRWSTIMNYTIRLPRTASVKISSYSAEQIRISDVRGTVSVENTSGQITLERLGGGVVVETSNGNITMHAPAHVIANATLLSVNGRIEVHAPDDANFQWEGEIVGGDAKTTFSPRVQIQGTKFRGLINAPSGPGPILTTTSIAGDVYVLRTGTNGDAAQSIRSLPGGPPRQMMGPIVRPLVIERVYAVRTRLGDVAIGEIRGSADIATGAGEIRLGSVAGRCNVYTAGGPLNLGDIVGFLNAKTDGGDVQVQAARDGGIISTGGGMIRLLFASGPTRLISGGGDVMVRQTSGPVNAETKSGDISLTLDGAVKSQRIGAKTAKGNVILTVPAGFAADVEAVIVTSEPNIHQVRSELGNLSVQREQLPGGKTRIRASGKINGGGERVDLFAEEGGIQITISPR